jgi:hypothetical protein
MRRTLIIDFNTDRDPDLVISPVQVYENEELKADPILDTEILCEALCTMVRLCHTENLKKDSDGIRDCIDKLKKSFANPSYKTIMTEKAKKTMADSTVVTQ